MNDPDPTKQQGENRPEYEPPKVITYPEEEILEELGPAQTFYGMQQDNW